jgi:uncharacterized integral membrane protein
MKLLVIVMTLLLAIGILMFTTTNLETRVPITLLKTSHPDARLIAIVFVAILTGIVYAGVIAIAEGMSLRIANRRLKREIQRLEAELDFYRARPAGPAQPEPDVLEETGRAEETLQETEQAGVERRPLASAPVYDSEDDEGGVDPGEDAYSGGRAV